MIKIEKLKKVYGKDENVCVAIDTIDLELNGEKFITITGKSGSGKSTLINMIGLIDTPTSGKIFVDGKNIFNFTKKEQIEYRRKTIGIVFQDYKLIESLNCYDNIMIANRDRNKLDREFFDELITMLGIENQLKKYPEQLSGGQRQRVAIARAMINKPSLILADEPTGNLDSENGKKVIELMKKITDDYGTMVILSTHDDDIASIADRNIKLSDGYVV